MNYEGVSLFPKHRKDGCCIVPTKDEGRPKNAPHDTIRKME